MRCGILHTPEVHADPSRIIEVPVLIFKARQASLPPMVNLSGGPGQSWADLGLDTLTASETQLLPMDFVFIEQRGTGLSRPRLDCPTQGDKESDSALVARCVSDLRAQGTNIAAYNIQEMAEDVATFQSMLGYPKITLDGVSYGTAWGLQILRAHSESLGSALLDSVVNPTIPTFSASASATDAAFSAAFSDCAADSSCKASYGDLKAKMEAALASLKTKPLTVAGTTVSYDDNAFFNDAVSVQALAPNLLPRLIGAITAAIAGGSGQVLYDSDINSVIGTDNQAVSGIALAQYLSVVCSDNQFVTASQVRADLGKVNPAFAPYLDYSANLQICQTWPYQQRNASDYSAVVSSVATLLVSGSLDPLTSPDWAKQAASTLSNGYWVEFPGLGHDEQASTNSCPESILVGFLKSPGPPDMSCVQSMTIAFDAPANPITLAIDAQHGIALPGTQAARLGLIERLAARMRIENAIARRHVHRRVAGLMRPGR